MFFHFYKNIKKTCRKTLKIQGDKMGITFGRPAPKIWESEKRPNFGTISDN